MKKMGYGVAARFEQNALQRGARRPLTEKTVMLNREAVGQVVSYCAIIAAHDVCKIDHERLTVEMNRRADVYMTERAFKGAHYARQQLEKRTAEKMKEPFVLPAGEYPRKQKDREIMYERRDAADMVVRYVVEALDQMGYDVDKIAAILRETRGNYQTFMEWAKDGGETVAYVRLGRVVAEMTGDPVEVVDTAQGAGPILAKEW